MSVIVEHRPANIADNLRERTPAAPGRIQLIDPTSDPQWDTIVQALGGGSFFHTTAWARVLVDIT